MKNKSAVILILVLTFSLILAAQVSGQTKFGPKTEAFLKILASGNYHMKATMTAGGFKSDMEVYVKNNRISSTVSSQGESTRIVIRDNKTYMIMDSAKMILVTAMQDTSQTGAVDSSKMAFTGTGTANFAGKNLPYEEYAESGDKTQFFVDGSKLAGMRNITSGADTVDTVISVLDQNVPDSVFNIPSTGYQVQDMSNFGF